jgi:hypothetical protein
MSGLTAFDMNAPPDGTEPIPIIEGATNAQITLSQAFTLLFNWLHYVAVHPLDAGTGTVWGADADGGSVTIRSGNGDGSGNGGSITLTIGTGAANGNLVVVNLPTSSSGLPSGALWCDTSAANVIKLA